MYSVSLRLTLGVFTLTLLPLAVFFGGNFPFAQGLMPIMCAVLWGLSMFIPINLPANRRDKVLLAALALPIIIMLGWGICQIIPLSHNSSAINPFWNLINWSGAWSSLSVAPGATLSYLAYGTAYAMAGAALYRMGQVQPRAVLMIVALTITSTAIYGIAVYVGGNATVLWLPKTSYLTALTATFINHNSYATFAGLGVIANLALALQRVGEISQRLDNRQRFRAFWLLVLRPGWPWMCAAMMCLMALVLTNSRAGLTASMCGTLVLLGSLAGMRPPARWPLVGMILALVVSSLIVLGAVGEALGDRLLNVSSDTELRQSIYALTNNLIRQSPYIGSGYGTFREAFSSVQTPTFLKNFPAIVEHAHNTYLELIAELGYPIALLLAVSAIITLLIYLYGLTTRRRAIIWPALGVSTLVLVGGHALLDFSLSTPAVTLASIAMLMVALAQSFPVREGAVAAPVNRYTIGAVIPLVGMVIAFSMWQSLANFHALKAETTFRNMQDGVPVMKEDVYRAQRNFMQCLKINPYHPTCGMGLAQSYMTLAAGYGLDGERSGVGLIYLSLAQQQYFKQLENSPSNPLAWYRLARISAYQNQSGDAVTYLANSLLTGPYEPVVAFQRVPLMLSLIAQTDAENASLFKSNIESVWQNIPCHLVPELIANPTIAPKFVDVVGDTPENRDLWKSCTWRPFPGTQALGVAPQKR